MVLKIFASEIPACSCSIYADLRVPQTINPNQFLCSFCANLTPLFHYYRLRKKLMISPLFDRNLCEILIVEPIRKLTISTYVGHVKELIKYNCENIPIFETFWPDCEF